MNDKLEHVWIFNGANVHFPSGVFLTLEEADTWITLHKLSGTLTQYPVGCGVYDHYIENDMFTPKNEHQKSSKCIESFSPGYHPHHHYEDGQPS